MLRPIGMLVAAVALAAAAASASAPTKLVQWAGFTQGKLAAGIHVLQTSRGSCTDGSQVDPRSDAWRCLAQGYAQDPCFSGGASFVLCPYGTPDSHGVLKLTLASPLPAGKGNPPGYPTRQNPWALLTATGDYCYRAHGTLDRVAGKAITYQCAGAARLGGTPDRSHAVWTIGVLPTGTSTHYQTVAIATVWW